MWGSQITLRYCATTRLDNCATQAEEFEPCRLRCCWYCGPMPNGGPSTNAARRQAHLDHEQCLVPVFPTADCVRGPRSPAYQHLGADRRQPSIIRELIRRDKAQLTDSGCKVLCAGSQSTLVCVSHFKRPLNPLKFEVEKGLKSTLQSSRCEPVSSIQVRSGGLEAYEGLLCGRRHEK
jgi:hypothetical protein